MKLPKTSLVLLAIQLVLVSSVAARYLYQRLTCPRVWTRAELSLGSQPMRSRYLSLPLTANGCRSTLPSAKQAIFPRNVDGTTRPDGFTVTPVQLVHFPASLKVEDNKLLAIRLQNPRGPSDGVTVVADPGSPCDQMRLAVPADFYLAKSATIPMPLQPNQELWVEVTVPPQGPPRPLQLAIKEGAAWKPLAFQ
jgi:hypothetical protein